MGYQSLPPCSVEEALAAYENLLPASRAVLDAYIAHAVRPSARYHHVSRAEYEALQPRHYHSATEFNGALLAAGYQPGWPRDVRYATSFKAQLRPEVTAATYDGGPLPAWVAEVRSLADAANQAVGAGQAAVWTQTWAYDALPAPVRRVLAYWVYHAVAPARAYHEVNKCEYEVWGTPYVSNEAFNGALLAHGYAVRPGSDLSVSADFRATVRAEARRHPSWEAELRALTEQALEATP